MALVKLYTFRPTVTYVQGVRIEDKRGRKVPAVSVGLGGRSVKARGQRKLDRDFGVFDLTPAQVEEARRCGLFAVVPA